MRSDVTDELTPIIWQQLDAELREHLPRMVKRANDLLNTTDDDPIVLSDPLLGQYLIKRATIARTWTNLQRPFGGPNPLTASLLAGGTLAALGYGGGKLMDTLAPEEHVERGVLPRRWAMLGGLAGLAMPFPYWLYNIKKFGPSGMFRHGPFTPDAVLPKQAIDLRELSSTPLIKASLDSGATLQPFIKTDSFNRMILSDQTTPPDIRLGAAGLVGTASLSRGTNLISPFDIARVAIGAGSGYLAGMTTGRALGALAGLTPKSQEKLQQLGIWSGVLSNVVPLVLSPQLR